MEVRTNWGMVWKSKRKQGHKYKTRGRGSWRKGFKEMRVQRRSSSSLIDLLKIMVWRKLIQQKRTDAGSVY